MFPSANVDYRPASSLSRRLPRGYPALSEVDTFARNGWILSSGMSGYFAPESVDTFPRNTHLIRELLPHLVLALVSPCERLPIP